MKNLFMLAVASLLFVGCATVTRGANETVMINTTPSGAQVETDLGLSCTSTPCGLALPRKTGATLTISKPGCRTKTVEIKSIPSSEGSMYMAGNILLGGFIGSSVDAQTGAANDLKPNPATINLSC